MVLNDIRSNSFYSGKRLLHDGVAEPAGEHTLNVLLTENIAQALKSSELPDHSSIPNSFFVTYHSELLNEVFELLADRGLMTALGSI